MTSTLTHRVLAAAAICAAAVGLSNSRAIAGSDGPAFSDPTTIDNPYLPLSKFSRCTLKGHEGAQKLRIRRSVLDRTRTFDVDGVAIEAVVVKDRVWADGKLIERTIDFFAQDDAGAVHYLGENVDNIRDGQVVNHHGGWLYGRDTQKIGVLMPGDPHVGVHWLSEDAPPITIEHDRVVSEVPGVTVGGHAYDKAIKVREFALPDKEVEYKVYAKGVGVVQELPPDGDVGLVRCAKA
jgi:hypothetical protein